MTTETRKPTPRRPFFAAWANIPFAPAKCPFFYGWAIVAVSMMSIICSIPGQTAGVGVFTDHLIAALGLTRSELSLAYMIGTLGSGFILPFSGRLLDFIGVRLMSVAASAGLAFSLLVMSGVDGLAVLFEKIVPSGATAMIAASLAFLLIRFFGQGNMTTVGRVAMGRWFNRHRGMATAIAGVPVSFAFNAAPWILNAAIVAFGWRQACWLMAAIVGGGMGTLGLLFFRDTPEECGLMMDGSAAANAARKQRPDLHPIHRDFTRRDALRSLSFWTIAFALALQGMIITAVAFHITAFGQDMGKTPSQSVLIFLYSSFISLPVRFLAGYVLDNTRIPLAWILTTISVTIAGGILGLAWFDTHPGFAVTILMFGVTGGIWGILCDASLPRYFGRKHLGAVSSVAMSAMVLSSAMGPVLFSYGKAALGSYKAALLWMLILPAMLFVMSLFTRNPQRRYAPKPAISAADQHP
jgi:MFS family permease